LSYATIYCKAPVKQQFIATGWYSVLFYFTHVITIVFVANFVFWLKDIDPRFREGEDSSFQDIPSLVEHKRRLEAEGKAYSEREKAGFFIEHIKQDLKKDVKKLTQNIKGLFTGERAASHDDNDADDDVETGSTSSSTTKKKLKKSKSQRGGAFYLGGKPAYLEVDDNDDDDDHATNDEEEEGAEQTVVVNEAGGDDSLSGQYGGRRSTGKTPRPSPSKMTINPMFSKQFHFQPQPSSSATGAGDVEVGSRQDMYKQKVTAFYQKYNPSKMDALPEILQRYQGKEEELLRKLHKQYNIAYTESP